MKAILASAHTAKESRLSDVVYEHLLEEMYEGFEMPLCWRAKPPT